MEHVDIRVEEKNTAVKDDKGKPRMDLLPVGSGSAGLYLRG